MGRTNVGSSIAIDVSGYGAQKALGLWICVEVVESGVFGIVEFFDDQLADRLCVVVPAAGVVAFAESGGHVRQSYARTEDGGGEIGAQARHGRQGRTFSRIAIGAAIGDADPARAVVVAGIVGAEAFYQPGFSGIAVFAEPRVPAAAGGVRRNE